MYCASALSSTEILKHFCWVTFIPVWELRYPWLPLQFSSCTMSHVWLASIWSDIELFFSIWRPMGSTYESPIANYYNSRKFCRQQPRKAQNHRWHNYCSFITHWILRIQDALRVMSCKSKGCIWFAGLCTRRSFCMELRTKCRHHSIIHIWIQLLITRTIMFRYLARHGKSHDVHMGQWTKSLLQLMPFYLFRTKISYAILAYIVNYSIWNKLGNFNRNTVVFTHDNCVENTVVSIGSAMSPMPKYSE